MSLTEYSIRCDTSNLVKDIDNISREMDSNSEVSRKLKEESARFETI